MQSHLSNVAGLSLSMPLLPQSIDQMPDGQNSAGKVHTTYASCREVGKRRKIHVCLLPGDADQMSV